MIHGLQMHLQKLIGIAVLAFGVFYMPAPSQATDLHWYWDQRCNECHGHAATFARTYLSVKDGNLIGRSHEQDLRAFLTHHQSGGAYADGLYAMLKAQATTPPVYQKKCIRCHQTASELARTSLIEVDGIIVGKTSKRPIAQFLLRHGRLEAAEIPIVIESLKRVLAEVRKN